MLLRTSPDFNYYVIGPKHFGPFAFPVTEDENAEREFHAWLSGDPSSMMMYGARPDGAYQLWRQPITEYSHAADIQEHAEDLHSTQEDKLVSHEILPPAYNLRPQVDYSEFKFIGQIRNWQEDMTDDPLAVTDIFLISTYRADRVGVFGVYGFPSDAHPETWWQVALNTTMPIYAPHPDGILPELDALIGLQFNAYRGMIQ